MAPSSWAPVRSIPNRSAPGVRSVSIMMTPLGWHRSNRNLRNLYPVRDHSRSRIIHGGLCVNAIDKPLEWDV